VKTQECSFCSLIRDSAYDAFGISAESQLSAVRIRGPGQHPMFGSVALDSIFCYLTNIRNGYVKPSDIFSLHVWLCQHENCSFEIRSFDFQQILHSGCPYEGRLTSSQVNFEVLRKWVTAALPLANHRIPVIYIASWASEFRLIDIKRNCVAKTSPNVRYLALSYIWEPRQDHTLTNTNR
jgi:hypothetical protein